MKAHKIGCICLVAIFGFACRKTEVASPKTVEQWRQEIMTVEREFATKVKELGMDKAFLAYAADDAVLMRGNQLIQGKAAIQKYMQDKTTKGLDWMPEFIEVAASGDLAYTYGHYKFIYQDSIGNTLENSGVFHTVWKRQQDGNWKYVWD